jgi:leader peptidase (prepilin peptidase)/N-methyltransferase
MYALVGFSFVDAIIYLANPANAAVGLAAVFVIGACIGSFLNVCIYRLPLEKSILWPTGSYCGSCWQPLRWFDNIPLLSYWLLLGRCRTCGARFSIRYFFVELLTAASLAGLFYLEVVRNVHYFDASVLGPERAAKARLAIFSFHSALYCLLLVVVFCDLDHLYIPLGLTVFGTLLGLVGSMIWAWPWPYATAMEAIHFQRGLSESAWTSGYLRPREGVYPWPMWIEVPAFLTPAGSWYHGLATGVAGMLVGTFLLRGVRFLFGIGMGSRYMEDPHPDLAGRWFGRRLVSWFQRVGGKALGIGDADLMMMAGSFLGWQPTLVAFFIGIFIGLPFGLLYVIFRGNHPFAFAPPLALGVVATFLGWHWIGPAVQPFFFNHTLMLALVGFCCALMPLAGLMIRLTKRGPRTS